MRLADLFDAATTREQAVLDLRHLLVTSGWNIVDQALEESIQACEAALLGSDTDDKPPVTDPAEIEKWRLKRHYLIKLRMLPDNLINVLTDAKPGPVEIDPYD